MASCWDGSQKQVTLYLCPCRKCYPGLWLWDRQHAEQKYVCARPIIDDKGGLHLRTSFCHHPKGNRFALVFALHEILQILKVYANIIKSFASCLLANQVDFLSYYIYIGHLIVLNIYDLLQHYLCCNIIYILFQQRCPATSLHKFVKITITVNCTTRRTTKLLHSASMKRRFCTNHKAQHTTTHYLNSYHIQSLCLLKQLVHHNRHFMIRQFTLHPG